MAKQDKKQSNGFYVRTKAVDASFVDHETGLSVHSNGVAFASEPVGKKTRQFLMKGGLVKATDEEVSKAKELNRLTEEGTNAFVPNTKIVMVAPEPGTPEHLAGLPVPKEVPLGEGDVLVDNSNRTPDDGTKGVHGTIDSELGLDDVVRAAAGTAGNDDAKKRADEDPAKGSKSVPRGEGNTKSEGGVGPNKDTSKK